MSEKEFFLRFKWLHSHLEEAGRSLRLRHRDRRFEVKTKNDGSRVTDIDREMSDFWLSLITKYFPGETVISEEDEATHQYSSGSSVVWYIDPIDGTSKFINGSSHYFVLIGLCIEGRADFGILYQPERNCLLFGTSYTSPRLYSSINEFHEVHQAVGWHRQMPVVVKGATPALRTRLETIIHLPVRRHSVSAHHITGPLNGPNSGYLSFRKNAYWDLAAPTAIMNAAGFKINLITKGEPAFFNDGNVWCERYYCLPPDTPEEVIQYVSTVMV